MYLCTLPPQMTRKVKVQLNALVNWLIPTSSPKNDFYDACIYVHELEYVFMPSFTVRICGGYMQ